MKLDINRINQLKEENEALEERIHELYKAKGFEPSTMKWYRENIKPLNEKLEQNKREIITIKATNLNVGDGISLSPYTDWNAYTVIERRETPKGFVLTVQEDEAIRTDNNGISDTQTYRFKRNTNGITRTVKWNSKTNWFTADGDKVALGRHCYYDYSF